MTSAIPQGLQHSAATLNRDPDAGERRSQVMRDVVSCASHALQQFRVKPVGLGAPVLRDTATLDA
jgi:hypothetical protein